MSLSDERRDLMIDMLKPTTTEDEKMLVVAIFDYIEQQDKKFINDLKADIRWLGNQSDENWINKKIDELAGPNLTSQNVQEASK